MYIGLRSERIRGKAYDEFIEEFMDACTKRYGTRLLLQVGTFIFYLLLLGNKGLQLTVEFRTCKLIMMERQLNFNMKFLYLDFPCSRTGFLKVFVTRLTLW